MSRDVPHDLAEGSQVVQFYESDSLLVDNLCELIADSFEKNRRVIVVAISSRRLEIGRVLAARGIDVPAARARNQYVDPDAALTLSRILVNAQPDRASFNSVIGGLIADTPPQYKGVWAFGDMVTLLWGRGMHQAALRLESLLNDLARIRAFSLHCAYPSHGFSRDAHKQHLNRKACAGHKQPIPSELTGSIHRLRAIERFREETIFRKEHESKRLLDLQSPVTGIAGKSPD